MNDLILHYRLDQHTGEPQLLVMEGSFPEKDLLKMKNELRKNYNDLVRQQPKEIRLARPLASLPSPARFRLQVRRDGDPRCPTLILRYLPPQPPAAAPAGKNNVQGKLAHPPRPDLEGIAGAVLLHEESEAGLSHADAFTPCEVAAIVLRGYVELTQQICRQDQNRCSCQSMAVEALQKTVAALAEIIRKSGQDAGNGQAP